MSDQLIPSGDGDYTEGNDISEDLSNLSVNDDDD